MITEIYCAETSLFKSLTFVSWTLSIKIRNSDSRKTNIPDSGLNFYKLIIFTMVYYFNINFEMILILFSDFYWINLLNYLSFDIFNFLNALKS